MIEKDRYNKRAKGTETEKTSNKNNNCKELYEKQIVDIFAN